MIQIDIEMPKNCDVCMFSQWSNLSQTASCKLKDYEPCFDDFSKEYKSKRASFCPLHEVTDTDTISRQQAIDSLAKMMPQSYTPDGSHPADEEIFKAQEIFADCIKTLEALPPSLTVAECTDIVSRQAVLDAVDGLKKWSLLDKHGQHVGVGVFCNEIKTKVKDLPSSPTPSRPHGRWIDKGITGDWVYCIDGHGNCWHEYKCSECNYIHEQKSNFCPHCGANMRQNGGAV